MISAHSGPELIMIFDKSSYYCVSCYVFHHHGICLNCFTPNLDGFNAESDHRIVGPPWPYSSHSRHSHSRATRSSPQRCRDPPSHTTRTAPHGLPGCPWEVDWVKTAPTWGQGSWKIIPTNRDNIGNIMENMESTVFEPVKQTTLPWSLGSFLLNFRYTHHDEQIFPPCFINVCRICLFQTDQ